MMKYSGLALGVASGVVLSTGAASAIEFTYQFGGNGAVCYAPTSPDTPKCSTDDTDYSVTTLGASTPLGFPDVSVFGSRLGVSDNSVNQFQPGLGIGAKDTPSGAWIGAQEDLIVTFSDQVDIVGFELSGRTNNVGPAGGTAQFSASGDPEPDPFPYENFFYGAADQVPESFDLASPVTGSSFIFSNEESADDRAKTGFAVYSITIDYEPNEEPQVIPVPPAAPLLGGALALLVWRARRSKRA